LGFARGEGKKDERRREEGAREGSGVRIREERRKGGKERAKRKGIGSGEMYWKDGKYDKNFLI
jgi:hypothetical protein